MQNETRQWTATIIDVPTPEPLLVVKIVHEPPPIPIRTSDWQAFVVDEEEMGTGYGATPAAAVDNLLIRVEEYFDARS